MTSSDLQEQLNLKAISLLHEDADKILKLIEVQMENLATRYCPLYEEVLDTQMYGFQKRLISRCGPGFFRKVRESG